MCSLLDLLHLTLQFEASIAARATSFDIDDVWLSDVDLDLTTRTSTVIVWNTGPAS